MTRSGKASVGLISVKNPSIEEEAGEYESEAISEGSVNGAQTRDRPHQDSLTITDPHPAAPQESTLTELFRQSPSSGQTSPSSESQDQITNDGIVVTVGPGIISQPATRPSEQTSLLLQKDGNGDQNVPQYGTVKRPQLNSTSKGLPSFIRPTPTSWHRTLIRRLHRSLPSPGVWREPGAWKSGATEILGFIPPVILGLLLNVLDALSYGKAFAALVYATDAHEYRHDSISS